MVKFERQVYKCQIFESKFASQRTRTLVGLLWGAWQWPRMLAEVAGVRALLVARLCAISDDHSAIARPAGLCESEVACVLPVRWPLDQSSRHGQRSGSSRQCLAAQPGRLPSGPFPVLVHVAFPSSEGHQRPPELRGPDRQLDDLHGACGGHHLPLRQDAPGCPASHPDHRRASK